MSVSATGWLRPFESRRTWYALGLGAALWAGLAYAALPFAWRHFERQKGLDGAAMVTQTAQGIPGDAINVGVVGDEREVICAFNAAGWTPADPVTLASAVKIVGSVVLDRPYPDAPVSPLFYQGRREDIAFQKPGGKSADTRHHVRFWRTLDSGTEGRPVWLGSASFDRGVGLSHYTLQVTHHIAADIDAERDTIMEDFAGAGVATDYYAVTGVGPTFDGHNGGGDRYFTDGDVALAVLARDCSTGPTGAPKMAPGPPASELKNGVWRVIRPWL